MECKSIIQGSTQDEIDQIKNVVPIFKKKNGSFQFHPTPVKIYQKGNSINL